MSSAVPASVTKASVVFRESVAAQFELETDFLDNITDLFVKAAQPLVEAGAVSQKKGGGRAAAPAAEAAPAAAKAARAPRKKSAYNVYVREMMKTESIQALDHKQKMGAIAGSWNALTEEQKKVYADMASNENVELNGEAESA
jgi:hypothetical protein